MVCFICSAHRRRGTCDYYLVIGWVIVSDIVIYCDRYSNYEFFNILECIQRLTHFYFPDVYIYTNIFV